MSFEKSAWFKRLILQFQLKETTERILAVDRAAAMIEEMMKQKSNSQVGSVGLPTVKVDCVTLYFCSYNIAAITNLTMFQMQSTCVYLGFEADPSSNVAARIRGPNVSLPSISPPLFFLIYNRTESTVYYQIITQKKC